MGITMIGKKKDHRNRGHSKRILLKKSNTTNRDPPRPTGLASQTGQSADPFWPTRSPAGDIEISRSQLWCAGQGFGLGLGALRGVCFGGTGGNDLA